MELLLELFSEEIPARMQAGAAEQLLTKAKAALAEAHLSFSHAETHVTPRRLTLIVEGLPAAQPDRAVEKKGPRANAPDTALEGFLRSNNVTKDQLEIRGEGKDASYFLNIQEQGKPTAEVLPALLAEIITGFHWPKSMRWGSHDFRWVRPLKNILCLLGGTVLPLKVAHLSANDQTWGHRFLAPETITVANAASYKAALAKAFVLLNAAERKQAVRTQAEQAAAEAGLQLVPDDALLDEVTGLVEHPVAILGRFDESFMALPREVITTVMRSHQKYFALQNAKGELANAFITLSNMQTADKGAAIRAGNERVLRARLSDGEFYWEGDLNTPLESRLPKLKEVIFHAKVGTMAEKAEHLRNFVNGIQGYHLDKFDKNATLEAAELCKADLVSGMVGEFPELQGLMGSYYALAQQKDAAVAQAIAEHYQPQGPNDSCPNAPASIVISLADKLDTLVGLFAVGEKPTGSKDPFALRRAALGVIRLMQENRLELSLDFLIHNAVNSYGDAWREPDRAFADAHEVVKEVQTFMLERLRVSLRDQGFRHDLVAAVLNGAERLPLHLTVEKLQALDSLLQQTDGQNLLAAYKRAVNILKAEEKKEGKPFTPEASATHLQQPEEKALFTALEQTETTLTPALEAARYTDAMRQLAALRAPLDAFFDRVTVNDSNPDLRINRLRLLSRLTSAIHQVADFSQIEGAASPATLKAA